MTGLVHVGWAAVAAEPASSMSVAAGPTRSLTADVAAADLAAAGIITAVVVLMAACAGVVAWFVVRARRRRSAALSPAQREQHDALAEYRSLVSVAERAVAVETKARAARLKAAERALQHAHAAGARAIASYRGTSGSARVTPTHVVLPQGTFPLTAAVTAGVDTAGNLAVGSRSSLTRIAAGGLLFGPVGAIVGGVAKKRVMHDTRELYLLIQGEGFAALITCHPDDGEKVRRFALALTQAAQHADAARVELSRAVAHAERALAAEQQNTAPLEAAGQVLEAARHNTARLDAATRALEADSRSSTRLSPDD